MTPCSFVDAYQHFGVFYYFHLKGSSFLQYTGNYLQNYTSLYPRRTLQCCHYQSRIKSNSSISCLLVVRQWSQYSNSLEVCSGKAKVIFWKCLCAYCWWIRWEGEDLLVAVYSICFIFLHFPSSENRFKCASISVLGLTVSNFILFMPAVFFHTVISVWEDKVNPLITINGNSTGLVSLCCCYAWKIVVLL